MVLFTESSEHLCQRYMRSTECPSSSILKLLHYFFSIGLEPAAWFPKAKPVFTTRCYAQRGLCCRKISTRSFVFLSVRLSVTRRYSIETATHIIKLFHRRVATQLVYQYPTVWQYSEEASKNSIGDMKQPRLSAIISLYLGNDTRQSHIKCE